MLQIEQKLVKNPNLWDADQLAINKAWRPPNTNPFSGREEDLSSEPPDHKSSAQPLGHDVRVYNITQAEKRVQNSSTEYSSC